MIRSHALKVEDGELLRLLEHDVQFFDDLDDSIQEKVFDVSILLPVELKVAPGCERNI